MILNEGNTKQQTLRQPLYVILLLYIRTRINWMAPCIKCFITHVLHKVIHNGETREHVIH